jgi:hypothetical protein
MGGCLFYCGIFRQKMAGFSEKKVAVLSYANQSGGTGAQSRSAARANEYRSIRVAPEERKILGVLCLCLVTINCFQ